MIEVVKTTSSWPLANSGASDHQRSQWSVTLATATTFGAAPRAIAQQGPNTTCCNICNNYRRKFRSQTSDNMQRWKSRGGKSQRGEVKKWSNKRWRKSKKMHVREKVGKSRFTAFFQWFVAPEGRKVTSLKRRVRSQLARGEMKKCTPSWREAHSEVKMHKTHQLRTTFGSWDVETVHAFVARSTFPSQNVQNTPTSDHCWKLRCRICARRCGAKHMSKSKCTRHNSHNSSGPLLEVEMSEKVHAVVARSTCPSQNVQNTPYSDHFLTFRCRKSARRCGERHISKSKV